MFKRKTHKTETSRTKTRWSPPLLVAAAWMVTHLHGARAQSVTDPHGHIAPGRVRAIQYLLRARGYHLKISGVMGSQTRAQLRRFQRRHGLIANGLFTPRYVESTGADNGFATWYELIALQVGSRGDAVRAAQELLNVYDAEQKKQNPRAARSYRVVVDGRLSAQMKRAITQVQRNMEILSVMTPQGVGTLGYETWCEIAGVEWRAE